jgi:hypothetical protein
MRVVVGETKQQVAPGSSRSFGLLLAFVHSLLAIFLVFKSFYVLGLLVQCVAVVIVTVSIKAEHKLKQLNLAWTNFGIFLGKITNPVILSFVFFIIILPYAIMGRLINRDILQLNSEIQQDSYWRTKEKEIIDLGWLRRQF